MFLKKNKKTMNKSIKILVCFHKQYKLPKSKIFIPIHCGRDIAFENSKDGKISQKEYNWLIKNTIGDNTGDNISNFNREFNEMTAIFWAWKNYDKIDNPDFIGLNHYRRFFAINPDKISRLLNKYDFITSKHYRKKNKTLYSQWPEELSKIYLDSCLEIMKEDSRYGIDFINYMNSGYIGGWCNMFVMSKEDFFNYCNFIFPNLFKIYDKLGSQNRQIGMFAERLTSFYLYQLANKKKACVLDIPNINNDPFYKKIRRSISNFIKLI